jgi:flagellar basal body-associated protein FliL
LAPETVNEEREIQKKPKGVFLTPKVAMLVAVFVVCVSALVAFGITTFMGKVPSDAANSVVKKEDNSKTGPLFEIGEFTTNLAPESERRFIKVRVVAELNEPSLENEVKEKLPILKDTILLFLNSKTGDDLSAENRSRLKKELQAQLNNCLQTGKIVNIYFSDLVIQ